jgi:hypothetical protein
MRYRARVELIVEVDLDEFNLGDNPEFYDVEDAINAQVSHRIAFGTAPSYWLVDWERID